MRPSGCGKACGMPMPSVAFVAKTSYFSTCGGQVCSSEDGGCCSDAAIAHPLTHPPTHSPPYTHTLPLTHALAHPPTHPHTHPHPRPPSHTPRYSPLSLTHTLTCPPTYPHIRPPSLSLSSTLLLVGGVRGGRPWGTACQQRQGRGPSAEFSHGAQHACRIKAGINGTVCGIVAYVGISPSAHTCGMVGPEASAGVKPPCLPSCLPPG